MNELLDHCHGLLEGARALITYLSPQGKCPSAPDRLIRELSHAPASVKAWKQSSLRRVANRALALARSYYPKVPEPALLTLGKPERHEDGSPFMKADFKVLATEMRSFGCVITDKMDPKMWACHYEPDGQKTPL